MIKSPSCICATTSFTFVWPFTRICNENLLEIYNILFPDLSSWSSIHFLLYLSPASILTLTRVIQTYGNVGGVSNAQPWRKPEYIFRTSETLGRDFSYCQGVCLGVNLFKKAMFLIESYMQKSAVRERNGENRKFWGSPDPAL